MPNRLARTLIVASLVAPASPAFAIECFSMFDATNALVYQSSTSPIDLSRSISSQMALRFPRRVLVISDLGACPATSAADPATPGQAAALLPSRNGEGPGAFGADATSPAPASSTSTATPSTRTFVRAPGARR